MWTAADVRGAARISPIMPKRLPAAMVTNRTASGFKSRVAPKAMGWTTCLEHAVRQENDHEHDRGCPRALRGERDHHRERARDERADEGDVGRHEGDHRDRAGQ